MNEMKPEDVMRALENGRYIDADELWNNRPENINKEGSFIDGWFYCLDRFSRHLKEMIDKPSVAKAALALLREKDAEIERLKKHNKELDSLCNLLHQKLDEGYAEFANDERAEAITEFAERIVKAIHPEYPLSVCQVYQIAKEMKGDHVHERM